MVIIASIIMSLKILEGNCCSGDIFVLLTCFCLWVCLFVSFFVGAYGPFMVSFGYTCGCLQTAPTLHCLPTILEPMGSGATFSLSFSLIVFIWVISKRDLLHAFSI
jgi:hypothetical protein